MEMEQPNILMIMADQLAPDVIGALGHPTVRTPHIDRLIQSGVTFTNCYCNSPICAASRASFVTGKYVRNTGVYDNGAELPAAVPTFMHHLRRAGYETVLSGKMHFVGPDQLHGFEKRLTTDIYPAQFLTNWIPNWSKGAYPNPGTSVQRLKKAGLCDWNNQMFYDEEVLFRSLEQIRKFKKRKDQRPFFLCASFTHPHCPFVITEKYWDQYKDSDIPLPAVPARPLEDMHPYNQWIQIHHEIDKYTLTEEQIIASRRAYFGMVTYFDEMVGTILSELERLRMLDNTIVIVTSDHGEMLGEHGMWFKRTFYDPAAKVPLIISYPERYEAGSKVGQVVSLVDLTATLMDIAQVPDYGQWVAELDGDSLIGLLENSGTEWKDFAISEYYSEGTLHPMAAIRKGQYKYVYVHEYPPLLFDLEADPRETINLAEDSQYANVCAELKAKLSDGVDFQELEKRILKSQRERLMLAETLQIGEGKPWDYTAPFDGAKQYVRS
jgi:choline-sulfatase